mgnify:FL=1
MAHNGLNAHEMACFLAESETPALVEWFSEYMKPGSGQHNLDFGHLPEGIVNLLTLSRPSVLRH